MANVALTAKAWSLRVNWLIERACIFFLVLFVLNVWLGSFVRYLIQSPLDFTDEFAHYLMIWMTLLAISSVIAHRERIGNKLLIVRLPAYSCRWLVLTFDVIAFAFFFTLFCYGFGVSEGAMRNFAIIYSVPKGYAFAGVQLAALIACTQIFLIGVHDYLVKRAPI